MRLGAIFVAFCMVLIAGSAGVALHLGFGYPISESVIVALAVLAALGLYNTVSTRLGVRAVVGGQLSDLSRGNADMARQLAELGRRLVALEGKMDGAINRTRAAADPLALEIGELGTLVRQLAETVAAHEARLGEIGRAATLRAAPQPRLEPPAEIAAPAITVSAPVPVPVPAPEAQAATPTATEPAADPQSSAAEERLALIRSAVEANRIDLYLQPIVTLPQRKVRYYEAMSRLRSRERRHRAGRRIRAAG